MELLGRFVFADGVEITEISNGRTVCLGSLMF